MVRLIHAEIKMKIRDKEYKDYEKWLDDCPVKTMSVTEG